MADRYTNSPLRNASSFTTHDPTAPQGSEEGLSPSSSLSPSASISPSASLSPSASPSESFALAWDDDQADSGAANYTNLALLGVG